MADSGWFNRVDLWVQKFLSPAGTQISEASVREPIRASQNFLCFAIGFIATSAISAALLMVRRGWLILVVNFLCIAVAANTPERRRKFIVFGVLAVVPFQLIIALFFSLFPWH